MAGPLPVSRVGPLLQFGLLAALVLVLGHAVALALGSADQAGAGVSLQATRHGAAWGLAAAAVLLSGVGLAASVAWRLQTLRRRVTSFARILPRPRSVRGVELIHVWRGLFLAGIVAFVVQENVEHLLAHGHMPGLSVLIGGHYIASVPAFTCVALVVAVVWTASRQRLAAISDALASAEATPYRAPRETRRPADRTPDRRAIDRQRNGPSARRAPPLSVPV